LCSWRDFELGAAIYGRDFDLGTQSRFRRSYRHAQVDVIGFAVKDGMIPRADNHVEIPSRAAVQPGIAFTRNSNALSVAGARLDSHFKRLGVLDCPFAMANRACGDILPGTVAARASHVELHAPTRLRNLSTSSALRALAGRFQIAISVTITANIPPGNVEPHDSATDRRPERNVDLIFEIGTRLRTFLSSRSAPSAENSGEDVAEASSSAGLSATASTFKQIGKIESAEIEVHALAAGSRLTLGEASESARTGRATTRIGLGRRRINVVGVETELVVNLALLGIAENVVGFGEGFELFFRGFIAGINIWMVLARKFAECLADVFGGGGFLHAKDFVIVFFGGCCHLRRNLARLSVFPRHPPRLADRSSGGSFAIHSS